METVKMSLFERIGGMDAVNAAVDIFYEKVLADEALRPFFTKTDMKAQIGKQKAFLAYAFGAQMPYTGKSMRDAHAHLVKDGLNETHFELVVKHLGDTLAELKVDESMIKEVADIAYSVKDDVLNR
ncbi:MAG: group 1 truncated hemoglobin [Cyclobacteriaceae bacterium]|nr:group 1 truncated hemoglobin [Cyclobacteriaceae bacterium HetDA_MAG_MS6]